MSYLQSIKEQSVKRMLGYPSLGKQHIPHRPPNLAMLWLGGMLPIDYIPTALEMAETL